MNVDDLNMSIAEVGNITSKCNGVTGYCLCHVPGVITFSSDNGLNFDSAITLRHDNGMEVPSNI
jgi:hypothetical protein